MDSAMKLFEELEYRDGKLYRPNGIECGYSRKSDGRRCFSYRGKQYLTYRVIFYLFNNYWPKYIDHIDHDCTNDRIENLRDASKSLNGRNQFKIKGYHRHSQNDCWVAQLSVLNKTIHLGCFKTEEEAAQQYQLAKKFVETLDEDALSTVDRLAIVAGAKILQSDAA